MTRAALAAFLFTSACASSVKRVVIAPIKPAAVAIIDITPAAPRLRYDFSELAIVGCLRGLAEESVRVVDATDATEIVRRHEPAFFARRDASFYRAIADRAGVDVLREGKLVMLPRSDRVEALRVQLVDGRTGATIARSEVQSADGDDPFPAGEAGCRALVRDAR